MIAQWMLAAAAMSLVLTVAGKCAEYLVPRVGLPRRWLWLALMVSSLVLPTVLASRQAPPPSDAAVRVEMQSGPSVGPVSPSLAHARNADGTLLVGWGVASLALVILLGVVHVHGRLQFAGWRSRELLGHDVAVSPDFGPAAVGLIHAQVVLPEWVFDLPMEEQRLVLRHELEHISAGDHFVLLAGVVMAVVMPWNAALWWQLRRLRVAMELDCDARVAPRPVDRPRYSQLLLRARAHQFSHRAALAFLPTPSVLAERLHALLDSSPLSSRQLVTWGGAALAAISVVTCVPVPSLRPSAAPPAVSSAPVTSHPRYDSLVRVIPVGAPGHPRYDSLVPYVPSGASSARGVFVGVGAAVTPAKPDSGSNPQGH
jgi:hypothetical protein